MTKIRINEYELKTNKIKENKTILVISDIHSNIKYLKKITKLIENKSIDYVMIPGDIIDYEIENKYKEKELIEQFNLLSKNKKIFISIGNHDCLKKSKALCNINNNSFFNNLNDNKNICILKDSFSSIKLDNINISAININNDWYNNHEKLDEFKNFINSINSNYKQNEFNILLSHSPNGFIYNNNLIDYKLNKNNNLILCGHNHGGLTPNFIQNKSKKHYGIVGPYFTIIKNNSYGYYQKDELTLLISNGVTKISKFTNLHKLISWLNIFFIPDIEIIHLKKDNKYSFKRINRKIIR